MLCRIYFILLIVCGFVGSQNVALSAEAEAKSEPTKLLRFPDVREDLVVFCYGGDLWAVKLAESFKNEKSSAENLRAQRLTAHAGLELFPKISPDGNWIAFTGQYDGDEQVYVIPAQGGAPRQLTFYPAEVPNHPRHGYDNIVYGWSPDSQQILFRSTFDSNSVTELGKLYTVAREGGLPQQLPMPTAGAGDFSPDGNKIVYSPLFRDFRHWKRYEGGWAQYLAIFDLSNSTQTLLPHSKRTERDPMWIGDAIYFVSDRTGTLNLFRYNLANQEETQLTNSTTWDVRWASGDKIDGKDGGGQIIFELGGELSLFDCQTNTVKKLAISVPHDGLSMRPAKINVAKFYESSALAPSGKRIAMIARGEIFSLPLEKGTTQNLSRTSTAHERHAIWSSDGTKIVFISDVSGEDQIYQIDVNGILPENFSAASLKPVVKITERGQLENLNLSPDGKHVTYNDCKNRLWCAEIKTDGGEPILVAQNKNGGIPVATWSPCSGYLAFALSEPTGYHVLQIYHCAARTTQAVTNSLFDSYSPSFSPNGDILYFLAKREFAPQFSTMEWNFAGNRDVGIFAMTLTREAKNPFAPESDSPQKESAQKTEDDKKDSEKKDTPIDFANIVSRVVRVPIDADNYSRLSATKKFLLYIKSDAAFYGREPTTKPRLMAYDISERKEIQLANDVPNYSLDPTNSFIAYRNGEVVKVAEIAADPKWKDVSFASLETEIIPAEEWHTIFAEVHRKFRDFFYVRNLHGYDWEKIGTQYRTLLPHVAHRSDLNYVISEMIAELNVGHAYIEGGNFFTPPREKVGLPGAKFIFDAAAQRYRISEIYEGQNEEKKYRSPLTAVGVDVKVGDFVLAIDKVELTPQENPYRLLRGKTSQVTLTVNDNPTFAGAREVVYESIASEKSLRYLKFVLQNLRTVDAVSGGKIGYLHVPNMGEDGAYEFLKWYYPQIRREGLVIDVRNNGGGNISPWIISRLNTQMLGTRFVAARETPVLYPQQSRFGYQVCLINETSSSDGDIFPYYFRKSGLGILIGKRTWGGVVGISPRGVLLDGGSASVPLSGTNDENGNYIIEGEGVYPDIEVALDPSQVLQGHDAQLARGISELLKQIETAPKKLPPRPAEPVKTP